MKNKKIIVLLFLISFIFLINCKAETNEYSDEIEEGEYTIAAKINNEMIDVYEAKAKNTQNVITYKKNGNNNQKWILKKTDNGLYTIHTSMDQKYVLDIYGAIFQNDSNVTIYQNNNSINQKWMLKKDSEGYYTIFSTDLRYVLTLSSNGNIKILENTGNDAQKFAINKVVKGKKTIEDGIYEIETNEDKVISTSFGKIIKTENNHEDTVRWYIRYQNDGSYEIGRFPNTKEVIDVPYSKKVQSELQTFENGNRENQRWVIKDNGDGTYKIISKDNGLVLDSSNEIIIQTDDNEVETQNFTFRKIENFGTQSIEDGYYIIGSKLDNNKVLDIYSAKITDNTNIQLFSSTSSLHQKWYIKYIGDGYYSILSNKDINYVLTENKNNIQINKNENLNSQKWVIKYENGYYYFINKDYNFIEVKNSNTSNETNIQLGKEKYNNSQKYTLTKTADGISKQTVQDGYYFINSVLDENYVVDLNGGQNVYGSNVQLYAKNSSKAQKWYVKYIYNGYYTITSSVSSNMSMTVQDANINVGSNVQGNKYNNGYNQQWLIKDAGDNTYYIISNSGGLYMDVNNSLPANFSNIYMNNFTGNNSQKFKFTKTRLENLVVDVSKHQGDINWQTVNHEAGIYGTIIRISAGCVNEDSQLAKNAAAVKLFGIPYGVYIFSYAENYNEGVQYANFVREKLTKYGLNPTLGIYIDIEWDKNGTMNQSQFEDVVRGFTSVIPEAKIYANLNYANGYLNTPFVRPYITWIAQWGPQCTYDGYYKMWQFTNNGSLPGINGRVDLNYYYLD